MKRKIFRISYDLIARNKQVSVKKSFIIIANEINYANQFAHCADRVINVDVHLAVHYLMQKSHTIASTPTIAHLHIIAYDTTY